MVTIKKKDIKKYTHKEVIDELIDGDGSPIKGDGKETPSEIKTGPQQTSDKFASQAIQTPRFRYGLNGTSYSHGLKSVSEESKIKMRELVEDIISRRTNSDGMVKKATSPDINNNSIPDMDELAKTKPAATRNAQIFVSDINRTPVTGDEKAVILNYILSNVDFSDVSDGYKEILRKQI